MKLNAQPPVAWGGCVRQSRCQKARRLHTALHGQPRRVSAVLLRLHRPDYAVVVQDSVERQVMRLRLKIIDKTIGKAQAHGERAGF